MASSLQTLERRILALEARLADVEGGCGATLRTLHRESIRNRLDNSKVLQHLGLTPTTDDEVDVELDAQ